MISNMKQYCYFENFKQNFYFVKSRESRDKLTILLCYWKTILQIVLKKYSQLNGRLYCNYGIILTWFSNKIYSTYSIFLCNVYVFT
jgi:hypothetical protein